MHSSTCDCQTIVYWNVPGFDKGHIYWDDEDSTNRNSVSGTLPSGTFDSDTLISYCCRSDGFASNEIYLPTDSPFVMYRYDSDECQAVHGMDVKLESAFWDTEDTRGSDSSDGSYPSSEIGRNIKLYYCYYSPK